ncbi:hypothetical protein ACFLSJ_04795 [Verrucomicrobiota bacterium]
MLTALELKQGVERELLAARRQRLSYRIRLYRALGGEWVGELERTEPGDASTGTEQ